MNWAVVMAGGPGTRFWPLSRRKHPKPFLRLTGPQSLLEETVTRLQPLIPRERILVVLQAELVEEARRLLKLPRENLLGEPVGRNTAPCCVFAASRISRGDPNAKIVFLPADQYVHPKSLYQKTLRAAFDLAEDRPVLLGMRPTSPTSAYGYLEVGAGLPPAWPAGRRPPGEGTSPLRAVDGIRLFTVKRFHEKPSLRRAREFLRRGNFLWNGGTFVWRLDTFKEAIQKYLPRLYPAFEQLASVEAGAHADQKVTVTKGDSHLLLLEKIYRRLPSLSLDYGVMEKMRNVLCLEARFEWKDLGGWEGLAEFWRKDEKGNRISCAHLGAPLLVDSKGNLVKSHTRLIALVGIQNLVVVDTDDALLICPRFKTEEIRGVVRELERRKARRYL